jgi:hypothetical protein
MGISLPFVHLMGNQRPFFVRKWSLSQHLFQIKPKFPKNLAFFFSNAINIAIGIIWGICRIEIVKNPFRNTQKAISEKTKF